MRMLAFICIAGPQLSQLKDGGMSSRVYAFAGGIFLGTQSGVR
jgi:hypothetical protein